MLVGRNADAGIDHGEGHRLRGRAKRSALESVAGRLERDREADTTAGGELERVRQQVLEDLLQALGVGQDRGRHLRRDRHLEVDALGERGAEHPLQRGGHLLHGDGPDLDLQLAGFDAGQVEDLVDEAEEVLAAGVDGGRVLDLLGVEIASLVLGQKAREDEHAVERRAQLVRHVREKLGLVARDESQLPRLVLEIAGPLGQLGVGDLQLLQQLLRPRGGRARVQHHAKPFGEPLEQHAVDGLEARQRGELEDALHLALEEDGHDHQAAGRGIADPGPYPDVGRGKLVDGDDALLQRALTDQAFARTESVPCPFARMSVGADALERQVGFLPLGDEHGCILGRDLRRQRTQHGPAQLLDAAPPLQQPRQTGEIRIQPVLFLVGLRALAQVHDHLVDAVRQVLPASRDARHVGLPAQLALGAYFARDADDLGSESAELIDHAVDGAFQLENLPARFDGDLPGESAVRHRGGDQRDVPHLRGQVRGEGIDALGEILPGPRHARHLRLTAQRALGADLARDARHLGGECAQLIDHLVDGLLQLEDFALRRDRDLP